MRRRTRPRTVGPDVRIVREFATPSVIAGHGGPLAVTNLRQGASRMAKGGHDHRKHQSLPDCHRRLRWLD